MFHEVLRRPQEPLHRPGVRLGESLPADEIKLDGNELVVRGSHRRLADAIGFMEKRKLGEVPSFANEWRARPSGVALCSPILFYGDCSGHYRCRKHRLRNQPQMLDEELNYRTDASILQRDDRN